MDLLVIIMTSKKRRSDSFSLPKTKRQCLSRNLLLEDTGEVFGFPCSVQSNTHAEFRYNHKVGVHHFKQYATIAPEIQHLDLTGCFTLSVDAFPEITRLWGHSLKSLSLEFCSALTQNLHLSTPTTSYLVLQSLNLANTTVTDLGVRFIASRAPDLTDINLQGCTNITDSSLSVVAQFCKKVRALNLANCARISNYAAQVVAQESSSHLQELNLNECRQISGCALDYLAHFCPNLKRLYLRDTNVSGAEVVALCTRTRGLSLTELNVHGLKISDDDLLAIANSQPDLEILDISFSNVTEKGIREVLARGTNLYEIRAYGTNIVLSDEDLCDVTLYS